MNIRKERIYPIDKWTEQEPLGNAYYIRVAFPDGSTEPVRVTKEAYERTLFKK